jgi:hypothetical protein
MAKRDNLSIKYPLDESLELDIIDEKPTIVIPEPTKYNKGISNTILVRSKIDAIYKTIGSVSGREYVFNGGGSVLGVNKEDVDELLSRRKGRSCAGCSGNSTPNSVFELV